jgi:hypothetical protein
MLTRLVIDESSYRLSRRGDQGWMEFAVLAGGANALLAPDRMVDQGALEAAIEHAEDWVMPHAAQLSGSHLDVIDATGRLEFGLQNVLAVDSHQWDKGQLESLFLEIDFMSARPHLMARLQGQEPFVADMVLLRELAHHANLQGVRLSPPAG